jgi:hypothetical protein
MRQANPGKQGIFSILAIVILDIFWAILDTTLYTSILDLSIEELLTTFFFMLLHSI